MDELPKPVALRPVQPFKRKRYDTEEEPPTEGEPPKLRRSERKRKRRIITDV